MKTVEEVARDIFDLLDDTGRMSKQSVRDIIRSDREAVLRRVEKEFDHLNANAEEQRQVKGFSDSLMLETVRAIRKEVCK